MVCEAAAILQYGGVGSSRTRAVQVARDPTTAVLERVMLCTGPVRTQLCYASWPLPLAATAELAPDLGSDGPG